MQLKFLVKSFSSVCHKSGLKNNELKNKIKTARNKICKNA